MEIAEHDTISFVGMNITKCGNRPETSQQTESRACSFTITVMWANDRKGVYFPQ